MYATDSDIHMLFSANNQIVQQTISRTVRGHDRHVGWLFQDKSGIFDDIEMFETRSQPTSARNAAGERPDGSFLARSGATITPIIPKAWILGVDERSPGALPTSTAKSNPALNQLLKAGGSFERQERP